MTQLGRLFGIREFFLVLIAVGIGAACVAAASNGTPLRARYFGIYAAGILPVPCWDKCSAPAQVARFEKEMARIRELRALNVNLVVTLDFVDRSYNSAEHVAGYHAFLDSLRANGITWTEKLTRKEDWFRNTHQDRRSWIFDSTPARRAFAQTDHDEDGVSDLDGKIGILYLNHEVMEYASHSERVAMYNIAKEYFPNTPIANYYGGKIFLWPYSKPDARHPRGGKWREFALGPGEADVVHVAVPPARISEVSKILAIRDSVSPHALLLTHSSFGHDDDMKADPREMWSADAIRSYLDCMLSSGVDGVLLRGFGRWKYDLGYRNEEKDPALPEGGWEAQRKEFGAAGARLKSVRNPLGQSGL